MSVTWSALPTPFDNECQGNSVIQIGSRIIIGANSGLACEVGGATIYTSDDGGVSWTARPSPFDAAADCLANVIGFAYSVSLDRLVAVGNENTGVTTIAYSDDKGDTWTSAGNPASILCVARDDSQGLFVAGSIAATHNIWTSPDGIVWTSRTSPWNGGTSQVEAVCYAAGTINLWVAVGHGATNKSAMTAPDPTSTWTSVASGPFDSAGSFNGGFNVAFDGTILIATTNFDAAAHAVSTSPDAAVWTGQTTDLDGQFANGLAASSEVIFAGGSRGIVESDDHGATWTSASGPLFASFESGGCIAISIGVDRFVAVGRNDAEDVTAATSVPIPPPPPPRIVTQADAPIRTLITDMDSRTIAHFDRLETDRAWLYTLNAAAYHTGQVPSDSLEVNRPFPDADSPANLTNNRRLVFSLQRWPGSTPPYQPIFGGIVTIPEDQGTDAPTTRYTAHDPWQLMMSRPIRDPDTGDLPGPDGITFAVGSRASDIALSFLAQTEAFDGESHIDSSDSGLIEATDPLPSEITFDESTMVGEAWTQLVETGTIDIHLPPMYEPIDAPGKVVRFQTVRQADDVAAGPIRADAVMGWDRAGNSTAEINRLVDGTRMANTVQFYDANGNKVPVQTDPDSVTANGVYFAQQFFPGANDTTLIALLAVAQLAIRRNGQRSISLSPTPERTVMPLRDYTLGDYLPVWASSNLREPLGVDYDTFDPVHPGASGYQRVYAIPLAADDNGVTTVAGLLTSKEN